jgi:acetyl esterase/lipase
MTRTKSITTITLCALALTATSGAASAEEKPVWTAGENGSQGFWHCWPDKLYADEIRFPCHSIADTENGFTFSPYNVFTHVGYRAVIEERATNDNKPGSMDATRKMQFSRAWPLGKLPKLGLNQQFHLQARIWDLNEDASTFMGEFVFAGETVTCRVDRTEYEITIDPVPDIREMKYGPHFRHSINFYRAKSDQPTPLVLNIHGGGWGALDKSAAQISFRQLLRAGISVASINYRFVGQAEADGVEPPVEACLTDAARALQFLRSKAVELNVDKERIGATGGSAGGATTLWLALHDDLADPDSDDPVARESTRLMAAAPGQAQTSLDPKQMREWIPGITYGAHAFGIQRMEDREAQFQTFLAARDDLLAKGWIQEYSPYELVSVDDPPIFQNYGGRGIEEAPGEKGWKAHSPLFGVGLKRRLDELGVENYLTYDGKPAQKYGNPVEFFIAKLKKE